jgi:hypothetical protein
MPILASFPGHTFTSHHFVIAPDGASLTVATERDLPVGTRGSLKCRLSRFDEPFTIQAEVMGPAVGDDGPGMAGLAIRLLEASDQDLERLRRIADGEVVGSVVETMRASLREGPARIDIELRRRPADFKMMMALHATGEEIEALIRDGNPSVVTRLLQNPRLGAMHVRAILGNPNMPGSVVGLIARQSKWMSNQDLRHLFCVHPGAIVSQAQAAMTMLPVDRLKQIVTNMSVRNMVRNRAAEILRKKDLAADGAKRPSGAGPGSKGSRSRKR